MLTFDTLPQVRVVRHGSRQFTPPPRPRMRPERGLQARLHDTLAAAIGMWPLTAVVLFGIAFLWFAGMNGSP